MDPNDTRTQPAEAVVVQHIESYLGKIEEGWKPGGSNAEGGHITLARYALRPDEDYVVLGSFGLSRLPLMQPTGNELRQEVLVVWPEEEMTDSLLSHIYSVAQTVAVTGESLGRGAILPIPDVPALSSGGDEPFVAWVACVPYFLPQTGVLCEAVDPPLLLTWLIPVYENEVEFITAAGVEEFEDKVLASREDLFSWPRPPMV